MLKYFIWTLCICQLFRRVELNTNATFDNLRYMNESVNWVDAAGRCADQRSELLSMPIYEDPSLNGHNISIVKRSVKMKLGDESWIGDYTTYEVTSGGQELDVNKHLCVGLHIEAVSEFNTSAYQYQYSVQALNCTLTYKAMCIDNGKKVTTTETTSAWGDSPCTLWIPGYTSYHVAKGAIFGNGNFTALTNRANILGETYWINLLFLEVPKTLPVVGNIFRCGYMTYLKPGVYYTDCSEERPYICRKGEEVTSQPASDTGSHGSQSVGLYAGISVSIIVVGAIIIIVIVLTKRGHIQCGQKVSEILPKGGQSFTRRNKEDGDLHDKKATTGHRMTTYNQINIDADITVTPHSLDDGEDTFDPSHDYATVNKASLKRSKPDVIPTISKLSSDSRPGYLTMNGSGSVRGPSESDTDNQYDFLNSTRSTGSKRYDLNQSENVYHSTSGVEDSTYDVTFQRHSSQKRLIDESYDRVTIDKHSKTMDRRICDSVNTETVATSENVAPRSNPSYDKVVIT